MPSCLMSPSHCLNQCWLIISVVLKKWGSTEDDLTPTKQSTTNLVHIWIGYTVHIRNARHANLMHEWLITSPRKLHFWYSSRELLIPTWCQNKKDEKHGVKDNFGTFYYWAFCLINHNIFPTPLVFVRHLYQKLLCCVLNPPDILSGKVEFFSDIVNFYQQMFLDVKSLMLLPEGCLNIIHHTVNCKPTYFTKL